MKILFILIMILLIFGCNTQYEQVPLSNISKEKTINYSEFHDNITEQNESSRNQDTINQSIPTYNSTEKKSDNVSLPYKITIINKNESIVYNNQIGLGSAYSTQGFGQTIRLSKYNNLNFSSREEYKQFFKDNYEDIKKETINEMKSWIKKNKQKNRYLDVLMILENDKMTDWDFNTIVVSNYFKDKNIKVTSKPFAYQLGIKCNDPREMTREMTSGFLEIDPGVKVRKKNICNISEENLTDCISIIVNNLNKTCKNSGIKEVQSIPIYTQTEYRIMSFNYSIWDPINKTNFTIGDPVTIIHYDIVKGLFHIKTSFADDSSKYDVGWSHLLFLDYTSTYNSKYFEIINESIKD